MGNHVIFYAYIRTGRIRAFVIISLILNAFSYRKAQIPHRFCSKPLSMRCFHAHCSFPHTLEQRQNVFARGCVENYSAFTQNFSVFVCCLQIQGISTSPHQNSLNIKDAMNNFLTRPVRIQVQNNQNRSRDSPPWAMYSKTCLSAISIKQATCIEQACIPFLKQAKILKCSCIKQAPVL